MNHASEKSAICLYEDNEQLADEIVLAFRRDGRDVIRLENEQHVLDAARRYRRCVLIMDRLVDNFDSIGMVERLRKEGNHTPVIVISSLASTDERIKGLRAGGDDYLTKPFAMEELIARVESLSRRASSQVETRLQVGSLAMDVIERTVYRGNLHVTLSPREFSLLEFLMRRSDQVVTRTMILEGIWKYTAQIDTNVVDMHISNLRRKIDAEGEPSMIVNRRGVGFILSAG